jgi:hypothetical protein
LLASPPLVGSASVAAMFAVYSTGPRESKTVDAVLGSRALTLLLRQPTHAAVCRTHVEMLRR